MYQQLPNKKVLNEAKSHCPGQHGLDHRGLPVGHRFRHRRACTDARSDEADSGTETKRFANAEGRHARGQGADGVIQTR